MTLLHRRILFIILFIFLLVAAPAIVLYGAGYRMNFEQWRVERVGLLHITTDPNDSQAILNGKSHPVGQELVLTSLKPGEYDVILTKDGYRSWVRSVEIQPGQSTILREIQLFEQSEPVELASWENTTLIKEEENMLYHQREDELIILDTAAQSLDRQTRSLPFESPVSALRTASNGQTLFIRQQQRWHALTSEGPEDITPLLPEGTKDILARGGMNIALTDQAAFSLTRDEAGEWQTETLFTQSLTKEIASRDNGYWIMSNEPSGQHSFLYELTATGLMPRLVTMLPYSNTWEITRNQDGFLTIRDAQNQRLFLIDTQTVPPTVEQLDNIRDWQWLQDTNELLIATDFEVRAHQFDNGISQELIVRLSTPLTGVRWHPEGKHVFYATEDSLYLVERDAPQKNNVFPLVEGSERIRIHKVGEDGERILYSAESEDGIDVWEMAL